MAPVSTCCHPDSLAPNAFHPDENSRFLSPVSSQMSLRKCLPCFRQPCVSGVICGRCRCMSGDPALLFVFICLPRVGFPLLRVEEEKFDVES
jgi:hypothetical protein